MCAAEVVKVVVVVMRKSRRMHGSGRDILFIGDDWNRSVGLVYPRYT